MAIISKNFIEDTQGSSIDITPVVVIANLVNDKYELLDCFSNKKVTISDTDNQEIQSKEIISKISGIKNDVDYDNKKIKINTFRFSIYDYYDVTKKLTSSDDYILKDDLNPVNSFIGKYVILYYKTPKTSKIDLNKGIIDIADNSCSIMFSGIINRITQTDKSISIQAEDFTQQYIQDKKLPVNKVGDLDQVIKDNIIDRDDEQPIPMIFGKVDRCPAITYKTNIRTNANFKSLSMIHDSHPITFYYGTSKTTENTIPFYIYLEDDDDYVYFPYETDFDKLNAQTNFITQENYLENRPYIFPEIEGDNASTPILCIGWTFPLTAYSDLSGTNTFSTLKNQASDENQTDDDSALWLNYGLEKKWHRPGENYSQSDNNITLPPENYQTDKLTRWILLKLDKNKKLIRMTGRFTHFTELDEDGEPNTNSLTTNFSECQSNFKPFNPDFWLSYFNNNINTTQIASTIETYIENDEIVASGEVFSKVGKAKTGLLANNSYAFNTTIKIKDTHLGINFFQGSLKNIDHTTAKESFDETTEVDRVLWYEKLFALPGDTRIQGHRFSSLAFNYITEKTDYESETFYASLQGRKDYASTEAIENLTALQDEANLTPREASLGLDGQLPDFEALIDEWDNYFASMYEIHSPGMVVTSFLNGFSFYTSDFGIVEGVHRDTVGGPGGQSTTYDDLWQIDWKSTSNSDDSSLLQTTQTTSFVLHGLMKKLYANIYDNVIHREILDESFSSLTTLFPPEFFYNLGSGRESFVFAQLLNINEPSYMALFLEKVSVYDSYRRLLLRRIFKYLYQDNLNVDNTTDSLVTGFLYEWDSFDFNPDTNEGTDAWINNLTAYLDDTINTINKDILDEGSEVSSTGTNSDAGYRHELYLWDENPNIYGTNPPYITQLWKHIDLDSIKTENFVKLDVPYQTSGVVEKPTDIFINLLSRELGYGTGDNILDPNFFNTDLLTESREIYDNWEMGFCLDELVDAKKLLEDISKETQSLFSFTAEGNFGLITIKTKYTYDDIDYVIDSNDIINYKITRTKREDVVTSAKYYYRYDNGKDNYPFDTGVISVKSIGMLPEYNGYEYYNFDELDDKKLEQSYKETELRYHTDTNTVNKFANFDLLNKCNQHLIIEATVPLSMAEVKLGDVIHIPLINNTKAFGIDYSKVEILNGQPIYPLWTVTGISISLNNIKIKAIQLHYLGTDGQHGFTLPGEAPVYRANLREMNTTYPTIKNYNYLPPEEREEGAVYVQGLEIPYGDKNMDGIINVSDIVTIVDIVLNNDYQYDDLSDITRDDIVNVSDLILLVNIVLTS